MGHTQSRHQRDDQSHIGNENADPSQRQPNDGHPASDSHGDARESSRRKRRRDSASGASLIGSSAEQHASRRRRLSCADASVQPTSSGSCAIQSEPHQPSPESPSNAMDLDVTEAPTDSAAAATATDSDSPSTVTAAPPQQSDLQQRFAAVQSRADASPGAGDGSTPPPHLDLLRDERERARRQILETLGVAPSNAATAQSSAAASTPPTNASAAPSPPSSAVATIAALLGAVAASQEASSSSPQVNDPVLAPATSPATSDPAAPASTTPPVPSPQQQQQTQRPQAARPQAFRVPLQPEMISGTSMVVQGALVARTVANRSNSPIPSSSAESSQSNNVPDAASSASSSAPSQPATLDHTSRDAAQDRPGVPGATLEGDNLRGAVTLEEQAVMLSRILGIAAAATAASLLNTAEAQQVDPSLLQTSLRRPFERMNQTPSDHNDRGLADWQRAGNSRSSSGSTAAASSGSQSGAASASGHVNGLRGRLAALSRRVSSGSSSSAPNHAQQDGNLANSASSSTASTSRAPGATTQEDRASRQQEIIAHLLSAAERQATSQRLTRLRSADQPTPSAAANPTDRARSSSFSASRPLTSSSSPQQQAQAPRSSLSRLVRSTLGSLMHPGRLLSGRAGQVTDTQSSSAQHDGWIRGSASGSGAGSSASADFSLGPNDVAGALRQVRNGILPDGVPGSFGSFLNHLVNDLMAAVQLMRPSGESSPDGAASQTAQTTNYFEHATPGDATSGAEVLDGETPAASNPDARGDNRPSSREESIETQATRQRDFQNGNLSFFRLFRFDPIAPSQLVPCIVVGVRSLNVTERFGEEMMGAQAPGPGREVNGSRQQTSRPTTLGRTGPTSPLARQRASSEGAAASASSAGESAEASGEELPASRFMLFVSGGRYPPNHPLLTSNPTTAGRDLMILMDLLSTMQAMQHKPATVTQQEIDASELKKIQGSEVAAFVADGKITENMLERCLVCLEEWSKDDDCRVLACRHAFHTGCVDRWMTSSSNTCPMCRRQGVSKDGRQAGAETADSRRAAQA